MVGPFRMAVRNVELHNLRIRITRLKSDKDTEQEGKKRKINMERSTAGTKKTSPDDLTIARDSTRSS